MRAILGKVGKSRVLEAQMEQLDRDKILMIDSVGLNAITDLAIWNIQVDSFTETIAVLSGLEKDEEIINSIDYIVLSLNALIGDAYTFLDWEKKLGKKFILTIQENEVHPAIVFDMKLPEQ